MTACTFFMPQSESYKQLVAQLPALMSSIHSDNVAAGWWTNLKTGESILHTRNRAELLMLAVSELAEAQYGAQSDLMDDKLPHLPMYDVELADFVIRLLDQIGAEASCGVPLPSFGDFLSVVYPGTPRTDKLMVLMCQMGTAMEAYRKSRTDDYMIGLCGAVIYAFAAAMDDNIDLLDIIEQKRAFNRNRADHKPENRRKADGKKF